MTLSILTFTLGPLENNTYLITDDATGLAAVIDPSFDSVTVAEEASRRSWQLTTIIFTHAHFDHIAGAGQLFKACSTPPVLYLHPADLPLYQQQGSAAEFGLQLDDLPAETQPLADGQMITLGQSHLEVHHTPGHSPGHVVIYSAEAQTAFCGDLVFAGSVGRTDLPGGSSMLLIHSIRRSILSLPPATRLLCGHGPETTVGEELQYNLFF